MGQLWEGVTAGAAAARPPFSLFMLGLVRNQERDEAKMAATQNSPPLDLLGEI